MLRYLIAFLFLVQAGTAQAVTQAEVMAGSAKLYRGQIDELRKGRLDDDERFGARVAALARPLIEQAKREFPESAAWDWELHTTTDGDANAFAMAGGKLLVSRAYVDELALSDAELAMLLAHEIMHAVLRHNLKEFEEALRLEPGRATQPFAEFEHDIDNDNALMRKLAGFNQQQELEADREGLLFAARAGWPPQALAAYFRKLAKHSHSANFARFDHPSPASRWHAARELAAQMEASR
ncbi:M48 family metalloprotease [Pseudoduganella sp. S-14]|uniref:M48 family metalloprotease n=1 Tax=Pseudoduganella sp. S-14 TaxID=3404065 RepID=UPI003CF42CF5